MAVVVSGVNPTGWLLGGSAKPPGTLKEPTIIIIIIISPIILFCNPKYKNKKLFVKSVSLFEVKRRLLFG
jgi:hypothetical protein